MSASGKYVEPNWSIGVLGQSFEEALGPGWTCTVQPSKENRALLVVAQAGGTSMAFNVSTRGRFIGDGQIMNIDGKKFGVGPKDESAFPVTALPYEARNDIRDACVAVLGEHGHVVTLQHV